jgi:hypothetical protein
VRRLLVAACVVPSSTILVTLIKEALNSSETQVLTRVTRRNIQEDTMLHLPGCLSTSVSLPKLSMYQSVCCVLHDLSISSSTSQSLPQQLAGTAKDISIFSAVTKRLRVLCDLVSDRRADTSTDDSHQCLQTERGHYDKQQYKALLHCSAISWQLRETSLRPRPLSITRKCNYSLLSSFLQL